MRCASSQMMSKAARATLTHPSVMSTAARATAPGLDTREREETGGKRYFDGAHALPPDIDGNITSGAGAARNDLGRGSRSHYSTRKSQNYS